MNWVPGGGDGPDAAVVVLLEAGLQLRHLRHRGREAGARNALQIGEKEIGEICKINKHETFNIRRPESKKLPSMGRGSRTKQPLLRCNEVELLIQKLIVHKRPKQTLDVKSCRTTL